MNKDQKPNKHDELRSNYKKHYGAYLSQHGYNIPGVFVAPEVEVIDDDAALSFPLTPFPVEPVVVDDVVVPVVDDPGLIVVDVEPIVVEPELEPEPVVVELEPEPEPEFVVVELEPEFVELELEPEPEFVEPVVVPEVPGFGSEVVFEYEDDEDDSVDDDSGVVLEPEPDLGFDVVAGTETGVALVDGLSEDELVGLVDVLDKPDIHVPVDSSRPVDLVVEHRFQEGVTVLPADGMGSGRNPAPFPGTVHPGVVEPGYTPTYDAADPQVGSVQLPGAAGVAPVPGGGAVFPPQAPGSGLAPLGEKIVELPSKKDQPREKKKFSLFGKKEKESFVTPSTELEIQNRIVPFEDDTKLSLTVQEGFDARNDRLSFSHDVADTRAVDPSRWLEETMIDALRLNASDLHIIIEGDTRNLRARIRVDGQMRDFDYVRGTAAAVIMGRLKAATNLSSAGSYAPEETIYSIMIDGEERKARAVLFRVEDGGEALVMRLPLIGGIKKLDELAFADYNLQHVYDLLAMPYKLIMLAGPMGSGKGSPVSERLLTPTGWSTYGAIRVGDEVIGSCGTAKTVKGVYPRGVLPVYRVTFNDGTSVVVDGDHLWNVQTVDARHSQSGFKTIETRELAAGFVPDVWEIPLVEPVVFSAPSTGLDYAELGRLVGEGESYDQSVLFASVADRRSALDAFLNVRDAEDSVVSFDTADQRDFVLFLVQSLGGIATVLGSEAVRFRFSGNGVSASRAISSIELVGEEEVVCIEVEAEDSLYVADHFIVTHNTTTAHGALLHVANPKRTVWTIEDPVERRLPNLVQLEINEDNGAGFDVLLSKLLRADYNTLFLGEIRDGATASAAVKQAKAGRQVMSTIHADDNIKALMRLIELSGDTPMGALSAVGGVISQRLVRKLNPDWDGIDPERKYKGRVPIHEILFVTDEVVEVMMENRPLSEIKNATAMARGSVFGDDARRLIATGVTDREELLAVIGEYEDQ